jgi:glutamate synthase (NADPH) small chain
MFFYGIPGYRVPRDKLNAEIQRILDMGQIEVRLKTKVGTDVTVEQLEKEFDAVLWAIGCQSGRGCRSRVGRARPTASPASPSSRPSTKAA